MHNYEIKNQKIEILYNILTYTYKHKRICLFNKYNIQKTQGNLLTMGGISSYIFPKKKKQKMKMIIDFHFVKETATI